MLGSSGINAEYGRVNMTSQPKFILSQARATGSEDSGDGEEGEEVEEVEEVQEEEPEDNDNDIELAHDDLSRIRFKSKVFAVLPPPKTEDERLLREANTKFRQDLARKLIRVYGVTDRGLKVTPTVCTHSPGDQVTVVSQSTAFKYTQEAFNTTSSLHSTLSKLADDTSHLVLPCPGLILS
eukprot:TRINITY_DN2644_c0_g1_i21.p1 TRINITY_DN2644_c0_g1~~TRINITY_DN2644_c0_g1_i21.p1  ORF type:complete len:181 (+),score=48.19 TRINITY_DN2644_c0_g1_i21:16-558(+)